MDESDPEEDWLIPEFSMTTDNDRTVSFIFMMATLKSILATVAPLAVISLPSLFSEKISLGRPSSTN
jgi:hypothetical protein